MNNTHIAEYKRSHPDHGCHPDCKACVKCQGVYYCLDHETRFTSTADVLCDSYRPDQIKEVPVKTDDMIAIDASEDEMVKRSRQNKTEQAALAARLTAHCAVCPEFKVVFDYCYRTIHEQNGITDLRQVLRSYFHYCPACGIEFADE